MSEYEYGSKDISVASIKMALTSDRQSEKVLQEEYRQSGILTAAVDYGGDFLGAATKIIERAVVAAKREGVIKDSHAEQGAVAGAAHEALSQITSKAIGFSVGGKIGIARFRDHVSVSVFFVIGLLNLNEVAIGLGHRAIQG